MKFLILLFLLLLLSLYLGLEMAQDKGYVLVAYRHSSIETTLWVAIISLIVFFLILYFISRLLSRIICFSRNMKQWRKKRLYRRGRHLTITGLCELAEGRWQRAEQTLTKSAKMIRSPLINYLAAAQAANAQQTYERRDNYLRLAYSTTKGSTIAVGLTQAQLQIGNHQWEQALATLQHLDQEDSHHGYILKLLKQVYLKLQDWQKLRLLFPRLRKFKVEPPNALDALEKETYTNLLAEAYKKGKQPLTLIKIWESLPHHFQKDVALIEPYTFYLRILGEADRAILLIERVLAKQWNSGLVTTYGLVQPVKEFKQLTTAELWLKKYTKEPELFLCLGRLSLREKFLGKARDYLQNSIKLAPTQTAYQELGRVYDAQGQKNTALDCYRKALAFGNI